VFWKYKPEKLRCSNATVSACGCFQYRHHTDRAKNIKMLITVFWNCKDTNNAKLKYML
jgi:hypothetical protein